MTTTHETDLLPATEVLKRVPVSQSTFQRWIKSGQFPAPVQMARRNFWPRREVEAWIERMSAQRQAS